MPSSRKPATKPAYAATDAEPAEESLFAGAPSGAQGLAGVIGAEYDPEKLPDGVAAKIVKVRPVCIRRQSRKQNGEGSDADSSGIVAVGTAQAGAG